MIRKHNGSPPGYVLETDIQLEAPRDIVFEFFADAGNLDTLTPAWLDFRIHTPSPIEMHAGTRIDYQLTLHGIPLKWQTEITVWDPPHRFVDRQIKGPYRLWIHEHTFQSQDDTTLVKDRVNYSVPGGPLVHWLFVKRDLQRIFRHRHVRLSDRFGSHLAADSAARSASAVKPD